MKKFLPAIAFLLAILPAFLMNSCANTTQPPSGGDKDTIPPALLWVDPMPGATCVPLHGAKFYFGFDEYVTIKDAKSILLSPPQKKSPKSKISGRGVVVTFEEDLLPDITYSISFLNAIGDNNEGNMFPGYSYVFSTGTEIDSMFICGTVQDCNDLKPVKGATVMLYKDHSDSAVFKTRPCAVAKTDDWGFFSIPFIKDTLYRLYAIQDENNNYLYDFGTEKVAFIDSLIRPSRKFCDTLPELRQYDMKDTLGCNERVPEYTLSLFKENPTRQMIMNKVRVSERTAYITFMSQHAWIDSLWIRGFKANQIITQFNIQQDSLEIWVNDRRSLPDTLHLYVNYRKTDSLENKTPFLEHVPLFIEGAPKKKGYVSKKDLKKEDTTCVFKLEVEPAKFEDEGFNLLFTEPIIYENFDSIRLVSISPKQKETDVPFRVQRDTLDIKHYSIYPDTKILPGYEYSLTVPYKAFRGLNGFYSDSTKVKVSLPKEDNLSMLTLDVSGVGGKLIVDLLDEHGSKALRTKIITSDTKVVFNYLKEGKYRVRITEDSNNNSIVDTGSLLEHRQSEKVRFYKVDDKDIIKVPAGSEISQEINAAELLKD